MTNPKVIVFCLDAFDMQLADDLIAQGKLSGLKVLHDRSARYALEHGESGAARYTGLTWEHFSSGQSPQASNKWSAITFDPTNYSAQQNMATEPPFLANSGTKAVIFDAPYFDLRQMPDAVGVVGWSGHDTGVNQFSRPASLINDIENKFGPAPDKLLLNTMVYPSIEQTRTLGKTLVEMVRKRQAITKWLLKERISDWDVAIIGFEESHDSIEMFCHGVIEHHQLANAESAPFARQALIETYEAISDALADLLNEFPDADIVTFSMHGMGWNDTDLPTMLLLPEFMYRLQFQKPFFQARKSWAEDPVPVLNPGENWNDVVIGQMAISHPSLAIRAIRKAQRMMGIGEAASGSPDTNIRWMPSWQYQPYWSKMDAFALPAYFDGRVRINLQGREKNGRIALEDYKKTLDYVEQELRACTDTKTGAPIIRQISRPANGDPYSLASTQADLHIIWNQSPVGFHHPTLGEIGPAPIRRVGGHSGGLGRMYIRSGKVSPGDCGERSSFDVAPTIMDLLNLVRPNSMTGESVIQRATSE